MSKRVVKLVTVPPCDQVGNKTKSYFVVDSAGNKGSVAANRGRRNVQRKLYTKEEEEDDEDEERGKTFQAGSFVYIV